MSEQELPPLTDEVLESEMDAEPEHSHLILSEDDDEG
jgi:hypothetical protein